MKFEDIKAGDTISYTEEGITFSGVAHHQGSYMEWQTEEGSEIAWRNVETDYTLVNRPTPEEPENLGAVVSASSYGGAHEEFVRINAGPKGASSWYDLNGSQYEWDELDDVTVLHRGWDGETIG